MAMPLMPNTAAIAGRPRTATVTAVVPSTLLVLDLTDYRIFAAHYPDLAHAVEEEAARRRAERNKKPDVAAEPGAAQPRARQLSGDARARPTNRYFALRPFFGLSGASPYHVPLNSLNSSIN